MLLLCVCVLVVSGKRGSLQDTIFCVFFFNSPVSSSSSSCSSSSGNQLIKKRTLLVLLVCVCVLSCEWVFVWVCLLQLSTLVVACLDSDRSFSHRFFLSLLCGIRVGTSVPEMWDFPALSLIFTLFGKYLWNKQNKKISVPLCINFTPSFLLRHRRRRRFEHLGIRIVRFAEGARHCPSFLP